MEKHINHLEFIIDRYDHYYDSVNNKGNFYLGFNSAVVVAVGGIFVYVEENYFTDSAKILFLLVLLGLAALYSLLFTLFALFPFMKSGDESQEKKSLIYYGSASKLTQEDYLKKFLDQGDEDIRRDLACQAHQLSYGLTKKFCNLQRAGRTMYVQLFLIVLLFITLFIDKVL